MVHIEAIEVRYFRSIHRLLIRDLKDLTVFSGRNDVGKSNLLKALNLFFNNEADWNNPFEFSRDFSKVRLNEVRLDTIRGKQFIQVAVHFARGKRYEKSLPERFIVTRTWTRDTTIPHTRSNLPQLYKKGRVPAKKLDRVEASLQRFLNTFRYQYVPAIKDQASTPNQTSGILCLCLNGRTEIIWPGDSSLARIASVCPGTHPFVLFGPHHGGPSDYKGAAAVTAIASVSPQRDFISVGTKNQYSHPRPKYLQRLERAGCQIVCSQITSCCDRNTVVRTKIPIMATHLVLGLRPPRSGLACRGPWRLSWTGTSFESDGFDDEHQRRITGLRRPQCLRGRASRLPLP